MNNISRSYPWISKIFVTVLRFGVFAVDFGMGLFIYRQVIWKSDWNTRWLPQFEAQTIWLLGEWHWNAVCFLTWKEKYLIICIKPKNSYFAIPIISSSEYTGVKRNEHIIVFGHTVFGLLSFHRVVTKIYYYKSSSSMTKFMWLSIWDAQHLKYKSLLCVYSRWTDYVLIPS
jgi:hypothetical protein